MREGRWRSTPKYLSNFIEGHHVPLCWYFSSIKMGGVFGSRLFHHFVSFIPIPAMGQPVLLSFLVRGRAEGEKYFGGLSCSVNMTKR